MKHIVAVTARRISRRPGWRSRVAALLALATVASAIAIGSALPAKADSSCVPGAFPCAFQVTGTPDNALWEWTDPYRGIAFGTVPNGYTLYVLCQANNGPQEDGEYNVYPSVPSQTWDLVRDPSLNGGLGADVWVYDWWMNTPPQNQAYNWYSWPGPGDHQAPHCNFYAT